MNLRDNRKPVFVVATIAAIFAVIVAFYWHGHRPPPSDSARVESAEEDAEAPIACAPGLAPIRGGGCFASPPEAARPVPLVVYVHGIYTPATEHEEMERQSRVASIATARGYATLALRGRQGECAQRWSADAWCWPSNPTNEMDAQAFTERWAIALDQVETRIGHGRRVLLGFSNGGYFAALVAMRALVPFDAIVVAHGGPVEPTRARAPKEMPPILLITADDDPSDGEMSLLDDELSREKWPHSLIARDGGHALPAWDIEMALTFSERTKREAVPLSPPLAVHERKPRDSGTVAENETSDGGSTLAAATIEEGSAPVEDERDP